MLKSNGFRHSKNLPVKFGFSPKTVPANIVKKLPPQVPSQTISHHDFQLLAQMAHVCFRGRKRVIHTRLSEKNRTQRLTRRNRGLPSPGHNVVLYCQRNSFYSTMLLLRLPTAAGCGRRFSFSTGLRLLCHSAARWPVGFSAHHGQSPRPSTSGPAVHPAEVR